MGAASSSCTVLLFGEACDVGGGVGVVGGGGGVVVGGVVGGGVGGIRLLHRMCIRMVACG